MDNNQILIITRNFPPLLGGMERLMEHTVEQLSQLYPCTLIGPSGCENFVSHRTIAKGCSITSLPLFLTQAIFHTLVAGSGKKYRFALAGSGLTAPLAGIAKLRYRIPAISFVHGLDLIADNNLYQKLFVPCLKEMDLVIANSRNTARLAENKGVDPERIKILHPGVTLPQQLTGKDETFLAKHNLIGKKVLLSVGRLVPRKGMAEFLQRSFPAILTACPDTVLIIIGTEPRSSLKRDDGTGKRIDNLVATQGLGNHIRFLGNVDDETLSRAYRAADLFIFPVRDIPGDVEGFGMVAIEAAAHGVPTLAFASGGVPDAVCDKQTGYIVPRDDYQSFTETTIKYLLGEIPRLNRESCRSFASHFEWNNFSRKLMEICSALDRPQHH